MFNEVSDLVFKKLKAKIEELGRRGFQLQKEFPPLRGGYEFRGLISYDTDSCNFQEEESVYGKNLKGYNIHPLYKEHIGQLARSLVNGIKGEIYEEAV